MKKALIIRIALLSVLAATLIGILVFAITNPDKIKINIFGLDFGTQVNVKYEDSESYDLGSAQINAAITSLDIEWIAGDVYIIPYDGQSTKIEEKSVENPDEKYTLRWKEENGKLTVKPCASGKFSTTKKQLNKTLYIYLPYSLAQKLNSTAINTTSANVNFGREIKANKISVVTISGEIWLEKAAAETIKLESVSGYMNLTEVTADNLDTANISGNTEIYGDIKHLNCENVSGTVYLDTNLAPEKADIETVSGKITFIIPDNDGFTLDFDSVSGSLDCEFSLKNKIYKTGEKQYNIETVSGNISVVEKHG